MDPLHSQVNSTKMHYSNTLWTKIYKTEILHLFRTTRLKKNGNSIMFNRNTFSYREQSGHRPFYQSSRRWCYNAREQLFRIVPLNMPARLRLIRPTVLSLLTNELATNQDIARLSFVIVLSCHIPESHRSVMQLWFPVFLNHLNLQNYHENTLR